MTTFSGALNQCSATLFLRLTSSHRRRCEPIIKLFRILSSGCAASVAHNHFENQRCPPEMDILHRHFAAFRRLPPIPDICARTGSRRYLSSFALTFCQHETTTFALVTKISRCGDIQDEPSVDLR